MKLLTFLLVFQFIIIDSIWADYENYGDEPVLIVDPPPPLPMNPPTPEPVLIVDPPPPLPLNPPVPADDIPSDNSPAYNQLPLQQAKNNPSGATNAQGRPVPSLIASLTVGADGPTLLKDGYLIEGLTRFTHERIPDRVIFAKGAGAHGYLQTINSDFSKYTKADLFAGPAGQRTPVLCRFSIALADKGSPDSQFDVRGLSCKMYTSEGNWDLVTATGHIWPVKDAMLMPSLIHSHKQNPQTNLRDFNSVWDFRSLRPETVFSTVASYGDSALPVGYLHMDTCAIRSYKVFNAAGEVSVCKFHLTSDQGLRNISLQQAGELAGTVPNFATIDLYNSIATGQFPSWTLSIQIMTMSQADSLSWDPYDPTKIWFTEDFPLIPVAKLVLTRNPTNYFQEVESAAFSPFNLVPGIQLGSSALTDAEAFAYRSAQSYRLGTNFEQLPVNRPQVPVHSYSRDGKCVVNNGGAEPNYYPNSFGGPMVDFNGGQEVEGWPAPGLIDRYDVKVPNPDDNFFQPRRLLAKLSEGERERTVFNIAYFLSFATKEIQQRMFEQLGNVSREFEDEVRKETLVLASVPNRPRWA